MFCTSCGVGGFGDLEGVTTRTTPSGREVLCDECDRSHTLETRTLGDETDAPGMDIEVCQQCGREDKPGRINPFGTCPEGGD
jgi:NMD protein affecting ribosome stability and mRNA decay